METANNTPEMLTIRQAAQRGILPERTIRRLIADGKIPAIKSGRTNYINYSVLVSQLNDGTGGIWQ